MGLCLSKSKNLDSNVNGHRSGGGGGGGGGGGMHYQKTQEPPIHYTKSPAPVAAAPQQASPSPRPVLRPDTILGKQYEDVKSFYTLGKELGRGQFGVTHLCTQISTGQQYACKSISKRKLVTRSDKEDMKREIQIMQHLSGQANIVEFKGAYEDKHSVHLVMELCAGGELFDRIIAKGHYSEKAASSICRAIVNVVHICHFMGVMHRDLKPENFLLSDKSEKALLKATDFGLSVFIEEGKVYRDIVGSAYYVAPEVLRRRYGKEIDIWSAGVILYILLSGVPPFWAETEKGIFDAILKGEIDFDSQPWPSISRSAKDLVRRMLTQDPKKRITSAQVLEHPWIREGGEASDKPIDSAVLSRMKQFRAMNKLKKLALKVIAENLSQDEIQGLKQMFTNIDTDNSGTITYEELKTGLARLGSKLTEAEVKQLMEAADVDGDGTIDYIEFITATMHRHKLERDEHLYKAFQYFDTDNSGMANRGGAGRYGGSSRPSPNRRTYPPLSEEEKHQLSQGGSSDRWIDPTFHPLAVETQQLFQQYEDRLTYDSGISTEEFAEIQAQLARTEDDAIDRARTAIKELVKIQQLKLEAFARATNDEQTIYYNDQPIQRYKYQLEEVHQQNCELKEIDNELFDVIMKMRHYRF